MKQPAEDSHSYLGREVPSPGDLLDHNHNFYYLEIRWGMFTFNMFKNKSIELTFGACIRSILVFD